MYRLPGHLNERRKCHRFLLSYIIQIHGSVIHELYVKEHNVIGIDFNKIT